MIDRYIKYPLGFVRIIGDNKGVNQIEFVDEKLHDNHPVVLEEAAKELNEYFEGTRMKFTFKLNIEATEFQTKCYQVLREIEYGDTASYKEVAIKIGNPNASRAVGMANNHNKLPIVIPCHRVIGANKKLVGYRGGLTIKEFLLNLEQKNRA